KKNFFASDHPNAPSGGNLVSIVASTDTAPTVEEVETGIWEGVTRLREMPDNQGEPVSEDAGEFLIMYPTKLDRQFRTALGASTFVDDNGQAKTSTVRLSGTNFTLVPNLRVNTPWMTTASK